MVNIQKHDGGKVWVPVCLGLNQWQQYCSLIRLQETQLHGRYISLSCVVANKDPKEFEE